MKTIAKQLPLFKTVDEAYKDFILTQKHPCVMAKTLFMTNNYHLNVYRSSTKTEDLGDLLKDLEAFIDQYDFDSNSFESFLAVFPSEHYDSELDFENQLWQTLQQLHELDDCEWDASVSDDPEDPTFSFSLKGHAFYIVGLHPNSSRLARQSPYPTIVFNLHTQFEQLRAMGSYKKVKKRIRKRDKKLQGHINPVLKDFGKDSETKQYSGRAVDSRWKCPFHKTTKVV
ncbi:guanitoxin biosynthesis heme-dependent pre-guanitoxin N-hydroxylase GntA [Winogradskyella psychrotolerans]|uniref:guanitoxin biosynthesis heme-dependent pre-guanitoxin N-hydroxylase GntA n=1 Tax=Winogradskyella psychrotolerans TaxID=1344585 RepID=UPI001C06A1AE|nr:guanitoxin biosynthesis heme-dependent pre-guanitoxin N-hydroxylase GntA [Winogradskyella psychrotolerans]MBU2929423.1 YqcI/YcgG family protein [Winogradskyella psychrotolerans]